MDWLANETIPEWGEPALAAIGLLVIYDYSTCCLGLHDRYSLWKDYNYHLALEDLSAKPFVSQLRSFRKWIRRNGPQPDPLRRPSVQGAFISA